MVTGVARDQANQAAPGLLPRLRIKGQRDVEVQLPEPHQPGAALRLPNQRAELLVGSTCLKVAEQRPDVRLADTAEDAVQNASERLSAIDDVPANRNLKHMLGGHGLPSLYRPGQLLTRSLTGTGPQVTSAYPQRAADRRRCRRSCR
jgi:hypothetical protein